MSSLACRVVALWGWRRLVLAFLAGVAAAFSLPPFSFFPALGFSFSVLIWLLDGVPGRGFSDGIASLFDFMKRVALSFTLGWCFGFGYFSTAFYWLGPVIGLESGSAWTGYFLFLLFAACLSVVMALGVGLAHLFWSPGVGRLFALASGLSLADWLCGRPLVNVPLNSLGSVFAASDTLLQAAALFGVNGLTFLCVVIFGSPAVALLRRGTPGVSAFVPVVGIFLLTALSFYGFLRVPEGGAPTFGDFRFRLVQPGESVGGEQALLARIALSLSAHSEDSFSRDVVTHYVWPGAHAPFSPEQKEAFRSFMRDVSPAGSMVLAGVSREGRESISGRVPLQDGVTIFGDGGKLLASRGRMKLPPFSFIDSFRSVFEPLDRIFIGSVRGIFVPGSDASPVSVPGLPPFVIRPGRDVLFPVTGTERAARVAWILNVADHSLFGDSAGVIQYSSLLRLRAVEGGLSLLRVADRGFSSVIDPYGRVVDVLAPWSQGTLDVSLPKPLQSVPCARFGTHIFLILLVLGFLLSLVCRDSRFSVRRRQHGSV